MSETQHPHSMHICSTALALTEARRLRVSPEDHVITLRHISAGCDECRRFLQTAMMTYRKMAYTRGNRDIHHPHLPEAAKGLLAVLEEQPTEDHLRRCNACQQAIAAAVLGILGEGREIA